MNISLTFRWIKRLYELICGSAEFFSQVLGSNTCL